jgi:peptide/nickel transport system substrate-binding protein
MRAIWKGLAATGALLMLAGTADAGKKTDTLVWSTDRENPIADSSFLNSRELVVVSSLICDRLVHLDEKYNPKPSLATSWTWINDTTLDFELRKGVKFHNGKEMDADDVAYSINFILDKSHGTLNYTYLSWIKSVEKLDSHKVRLHLHKPFPTALIFIAGVGNILPNGHYETAPARADGKKDYGAVTPVGTGPYRIAEIKPGEYIHMVKNADYFKDSPKGTPQIGAIRFRTIKDQNTRLAELMTGGIDWTWDVPKEQAERMQGNPALTIENAATMRFSYIAFDVKGTSGQKAFTDKRVRQAVAHAINREAIVKNLVGGPSVVINAACHPDQFACADDVPKYEYNPTKAKALLAEAGYPNGFDFDLYAYREREYTEAVIGDLAKVGLKAKLNFVQYTALLEAIHKGQTPAVHGTWGSSSIPDVSAATGHFFQGTTDDLVKDPEVISLIAEANGIVDPDKRKAVWRQALVRIADQAYWVPMFTYAKYYAYTKDLDFKATSDEIPQFFRAKWK